MLVAVAVVHSLALSVLVAAEAAVMVVKIQVKAAQHLWQVQLTQAVVVEAERKQTEPLAVPVS
jgi:hypothetical protein